MITATTSVVGDAEVKASFVHLGSSVRARVREALLGLGREAQGMAQGRVPVRTGDLRDSIRVSLSESDKRVTLTVRPKGRENFIGRLMEYGVVSHGTRNNEARAGGNRVRAARVRAKRSLGEYRILPHPFMGPAEEMVRARLDGTLAAAVDAAVDGVR